MDSCSYNMIFSSKQNQAVITIRMNAGRQNQQIPISYIHLNFWETLIISYSFICVSCTYTEWLAKENSLTVSVNMCVCEGERERERMDKKEGLMTTLSVLCPPSSTPYPICHNLGGKSNFSLCSSLFYFLVWDKRIEGRRSSAQLHKESG